MLLTNAKDCNVWLVTFFSFFVSYLTKHSYVIQHTFHISQKKDGKIPSFNEFLFLFYYILNYCKKSNLIIFTTIKIYECEKCRTPFRHLLYFRSRRAFNWAS